MGLLIDAAVVLVLVAAFASVSRLLGPRSPAEGDRLLPYETGMRPLDVAVEKMSVPYIRYALLFVLFDVETAFLIAWGAARPILNLELMASFTAFAALLAFLLAYVWNKGALEVR